MTEQESITLPQDVAATEFLPSLSKPLFVEFNDPCFVALTQYNLIALVFNEDCLELSRNYLKFAEKFKHCES